MRRRLFALASAIAVIVPLGLSVPLGAAQAAPSATGQAARNVAVCPTPQYTDTARCHAILHEFVDRNGRPKPASSSPTGYGPLDLQSAYNVPTSAGLGQTIAIVDAYDNPNAASDLAAYRSYYNLPATASCTVDLQQGTVTSSSTTQPCFAKVNQNGVAGSYPRGDTGWGQEISLDLDMASAICPNCNILLVEAASSSFKNLGTAVNTAASLHVAAISNSYGSSGDVSDATYGKYYDHPGIAVTASTGDNGYGVGYPATSAFAIAVGGTSLNHASSGWTESAWSGAGSGCSSYQAEPGYQTDYGLTACNGKRAIADVSAVADPYTGVAVYDTYGTRTTWAQFGGTSASSPIIAAMYALAKGQGASWPDYPAATLYKDWSGLNDVTSGSNGTCSTTVLCTSGANWDGPTGLGTPNGTAAFTGQNSVPPPSTSGTPAPTNLTAVAGTSTGTVDLGWTAPSGGPYSYDVYRATSPGAEYPGTPVKSGLTTTTWTDSNLSDGTYYYVVTAVQSGAESAPSNEANVTLGTATPPSALTVTVTPGGTSKKGKNYQTPITVDSTVAGFSVALDVYSGSCPGSTLAARGSTSTSGSSVTFNFNTKSAGWYCAVANVTADSGATGTGQASFQVK